MSSPKWRSIKASINFLRCLLALAILAPIAYFREKGIRVPLDGHLAISFIVLGVLGIFVTQLLFLLGLEYTNPSYSAAVQPATPVLAFIIAVLMGTETVNLRKIQGQAKLIGTTVCVSSAILMVIYRGPAVFDHKVSDVEISAKSQSVRLSSNFLELGFNTWNLGVLCLIGGCISVATHLSIQARVLVKYPASISLTAYSMFFGTLCMMVAAFFMANKSTDWNLSQSEIFAVCYAGIFMSALYYGLVAWSNKIVGPAMVSLYYPLLPVASTFMSMIFLGSPVYLGSILGGVLIIGGLYLVTWASHKERQAILGYPGRTTESSEPLINQESPAGDIL